MGAQLLKFIFGFCVIPAFFCVKRAKKLSRDKVLWGFLGFFLSYVALLIIYLLPETKKEKKLLETDTNRCHFCGEEILDTAIKCKHCGEWLQEEYSATQSDMIECPYCAEEIEDSVEVCPLCKETLVKKKVKEITECPFCCEEIAEDAIKCKHCGEWLNESEEVEYKPSGTIGFGGRLVRALILAVVSWALFYYGSWDLVVSKKISSAERFFAALIANKGSKNILLDEYYLLLRINDRFYGFANDTQFFDSPLIQWIMLGMSLTALFYALWWLIFRDIDSFFNK